MKPLSPKETEVLKLACEGLGIKASANKLGISHKTVSSHRVRIYQKTGCTSSTQLGVWAVKQGIV